MTLPLPGDLLLDKYRVERVLGEGGYGRVYAAITIETGRPVAIKVLKVGQSLDAAARVTRFMREMRAIAKLKSPHTVTLFDYGRAPGGAPLMVCEYVDGEDLDELLARRGRLKESEVMHVLTQVLLSLAEAHDVGVLHRDIKPSNVRLFEYAGDPLRVKVLDFGLAKSLADDEARLTKTGKVIGTPRYMSPDQLRGLELSPASDVFSAGLVAHAMLIGLDRFRELAIGEPRRLGADVDVSEPTRDLINRMLAIDVQDRFGSAHEVLAAIGSVRANSSTATPKPPELVAAQPPRRDAPSASLTVVDTVQRSDEPRRSRVALTAVAVGLVAVVVALALWPDDHRPPAPAPTAVSNVGGLLRSAAEPVATQAEIGPRTFDVGTDELGAPTSLGGCGSSPPFVGSGKLQLGDDFAPRALAVHIPAQYDPNIEHAVVVLLHESTASPRGFIADSNFGRLADEHRFIVVAPDGGNFLAWEERPIPIVRQAIDDVERTLCVDSTRIFVVGHSSGGGIAELAPCKLPGVRAIATTAFRRSTGGSPGCTDMPIPSLHIAGTDDRYNPIDGGESCSGAMKVSLATKQERWRERNGCGQRRSTWLSRTHGRCSTWDCETPFVSCVVDGGRGWNGTGARALDFKGCDGEPADFGYAEAIWRFFESVSSPEQDGPPVETGGP